MSDPVVLLHQQAIAAALSANWEEALRINKQIFETEPQNTDVLNRLARAYFELGDLSESKRYYQQSLKYDPYNQIAIKFLKRIESFGKKGTRNEIRINSSPIQITPDFFIEQPGKTKSVSLVKVAEPQRLSLLSPGEFVKLVPKSRSISVTTPSDEYLGAIPDDLSHILLRLIKGGNKYSAFIKTIKTNSLSILIHEVFRAARFRNQPSFLDSSSQSTTYSSDNIVIPLDGSEYASEEGEEEESA